MFVVLDAVATMDLDLLRRQRFVQQAPFTSLSEMPCWGTLGVVIARRRPS